MQKDPHFRDYVTFFEYFHGDTGAGLGASHQQGGQRSSRSSSNQSRNGARRIEGIRSALAHTKRARSRSRSARKSTAASAISRNLASVCPNGRL